MRIVSFAGIAGSLVAGGTTVLYLAIIRSQGDQTVAAVAPWAATLLVCAFVGVIASYVESPRGRSLLFAATAGTMLGVGFLAIFSVGTLLIVAGLLFAVAAAGAVPSGSFLPWVVGTGACIVVPAALLATT